MEIISVYSISSLTVIKNTGHMLMDSFQIKSYLSHLDYMKRELISVQSITENEIHNM